LTEPRYLYSALTRLRTVSTSRRADLLREEVDLAAVLKGARPGGMDPKLARALEGLDTGRCMEEDRAVEAGGAVIVAFTDPSFPRALRCLPDPPPALYLKGDPGVLGHPSVAVVGSRMATVYGKNAAETLSADLAREGFTVVSGLARGIDTAAHEGSLNVRGRAAAVLGTGIDRVYPPENRDLAGRILREGGVLLSEYPPGTPPLPGHFPVRNRLIAGLAWAVVVVEATERSGSLITARLALEGGKELFAVPHNITSRTGVGPNTLIRRGARLVQRVEDLIEEMPDFLRGEMRRPSPGEEDSGTGAARKEAVAVLDLIPADGSLHADELAVRAGLEMSRLLPLLLELQMAGLCVELPGMRFTRKGVG